MEKHFIRSRLPQSFTFRISLHRDGMPSFSPKLLWDATSCFGVSTARLLPYKFNLLTISQCSILTSYSPSAFFITLIFRQDRLLTVRLRKSCSPVESPASIKTRRLQSRLPNPSDHYPRESFHPRFHRWNTDTF